MSAAATPAGTDRSSLLTLLGGNVLLELGVGFFFPVLPIFLAHRGGNAAFVGAVVASGVAAKVIAQYPGGRLADRHGRRPVLVFSLGLYTACFLGYLLPLPLVAFLGIRFVQALMIGAYIPAANAAIADLTPPAERGRAFSQLRATEMAGLLIGPVLGGLVANLDLEAVFAAAAAVCTVGTVLLLRLPRTRPVGQAEVAPPRPSRDLLWRLAPVLVIGGAIYYTIGTYDSDWSLYMVSRGASPLQVGLSFAVYALPVMIVAVLFAGWVDRVGVRRAGGLAVGAYAFFNWLYPLLTDPWVLIASGVGEGAVTALATPALSAEVSRQAPPGAQATTQAVASTGMNIALALGSIVGGPLYTLAPRAAFWTSAGVCAVALVLTAAAVPRPRAARAPS